jgi:tRNA(fMet)-specific endonuclease VapC
MYLVETSAISLHQRGSPHLASRIAATDPSLLYTSLVVVEEQLRGRLAVISGSSQNPPRLIAAYIDLEQTLRYFQAWQVLPFTGADYQTFRRLRRNGVRIGTHDLRIAASALNQQMTVVTANVSDFARVPGLKVEGKGSGGTACMKPEHAWRQRKCWSMNKQAVGVDRLRHG